MQLTVAQIAEFSRALTVVPARDLHQQVQRVCWDTRGLQPGMLYIALPGQQVDGNDYIVEAFEKGAAVVISSRQVNEAERLAAEQNRASLLYATDGQLALQNLARGYRGLLSAKVLAITGSSGKTSTKSLVTAVLEKAFLTVSSQGNRNNEIGLPATVLSASSSTEILVVEMAMRGIGQIEELCDIARPHIGIVTNIGPVHLELLGTKENVARAKAELICALPDVTGIAILNGDDPYTPFIKEVAQTEAREIRILSFGLGSHNDIRADHITYDEQGRPSFDLWTYESVPQRVTLALKGEHSVLNALAAAAAGVALDIASEFIITALEAAQPTPMRQVTTELEDGTVLIDDTYNANPDSMRVALKVLEHVSKDKLHIAVLGDMGELGTDEIALHREIGALAPLTGVDVLVTIGELAQQYAVGARNAGMNEENIVSCNEIDEALIALAPYRAQSPVILVKASRFMALERISDGLKKGIIPEITSPSSEEVCDS
jgi:UDP-N-acetylmuramoyl-tripeptide--D-alanyl-D-alanine ligase